MSLKDFAKKTIKKLRFDIKTAKIDKRIRAKVKAGEKINVLFICHRPAVWSSLKTVFEALVLDDAFDVKIVAIPNKKEIPGIWFDHDEYESEGAEDFFSKYGAINGYDYENKVWLDLKTLEPDYVFFQQPYNVARYEEYQSGVVSAYAKILYVAYATDFIGDGVLEETTPKDFMGDVSYYFTQNALDDKLLRGIFNRYNNASIKTVMTGFPRYDGIERYRGSDSDLWKGSDNGYRVMWTPRWCTNEGNCTFFDFKDKLVDYCKDNERINFLFRPHPQAFSNWNQTGELGEAEAFEYKKLFFDSSNMNIDEKSEYMDTIFSSNCLISDTSSFIADYFLTGNPVIYCHKIDKFNDFSRRMAEGFYWVESWEELKDTLDMLIGGNDPLQSKREELINELFNSDGVSAGRKITEFIKTDAGIIG